ncbi:hypothetical protein ACSL103130_00685 [Actinomyces slackii]|uniref:Lipoprotein n=1 Tax=Actinomyces slackii TaxID=52774 RepID=A0A448KD50_9ACTO|nr:hypothetical protein [Actinomyces slackii]VEG74859.1 Uncharacterised protein [Actinomyces slackii]
MSASSASSQRGLAVAATAALAASLVACSSGQNAGSEASLPSYNPSANPSASAGPSGAPVSTGASSAASGDSSAATATITAEELSQPDIEYTVTGIPEDLSAEQVEVLKAYVTYDARTWQGAREVSGIESIEPLMTGTVLDNYRSFYSELQSSGTHYEGSYTAEVLSVDVAQGGDEATVQTCSDYTRMKRVDETGQEVQRTDGSTYELDQIVMSNVGGKWIVLSIDGGSVETC